MRGWRARPVIVYAFLAVLAAVSGPALASEPASELASQPAAAIAELADHEWDGEKLTVYYDGNCGPRAIGAEFRFGNPEARGVKVVEVILTEKRRELPCTRVGGYYRKAVLDISALALEEATRQGIAVLSPYAKFHFIAAFTRQRTVPGRVPSPEAREHAERD